MTSSTLFSNKSLLIDYLWGNLPPEVHILIETLIAQNEELTALLIDLKNIADHLQLTSPALKAHLNNLEKELLQSIHQAP